MIHRVVEPELLDSLPADDPRAVHSRRDLRVLNAWMGNARHIARAIERLKNPPQRILELGAGDGTLLLTLAQKFRQPVEVWLLDMQPVISADTLTGFRNLGWSVQIAGAKMQEWLNSSKELHFDLVLANLFLHHFSDEELRALLARISEITRNFISCDPRRWAPALLATKFLWLIGCNQVTLHDAQISVRAGFRDKELTSLWPASSSFNLQEDAAGLASHLFCAVSNEGFSPRQSLL